jgi:hypothetical protein
VWQRGQEWVDCFLFAVTSPEGRPIADARLSLMQMSEWSGNSRYGWGQGWSTDRRGYACDEMLLYPGTITVTAPPALGGRCAGETEFEWDGWNDPLRYPIRRVKLNVKRLPRTRLRLRLVARDRQPIQGAHVSVESIDPAGTDCSDRGPDDWFETDADGTLALPLLPKGEVTLRIRHKGYAEQVSSVETQASPQTLSLERGARWTGRLLDPDGKPIERCQLHIAAPSQIYVDASCTPSGFDIAAIPAGYSRVTVRVTAPHPMLAEHVLVMNVNLRSDEVRQNDIRWPVGLPITGQVVTMKGAAVPRASVRLTSQNLEQGSAEGLLQIEADADGRFAFWHLIPGGWSIMGSDGASSSSGWLGIYAGMKHLRLVVRAGR